MSLPSIPSKPGQGTAIIAAADRVKAIGEQWVEQEPMQLVKLLEQQARRIGELHQQLEHQQQYIAQLEAKLEASERAGKRQAAPFRIDPDKRQHQPKRPGRKGGHAGQWRRTPPEQSVDERIEVPLEHCPECGHSLDVTQQRVMEQTLIEVPVVQARVIRLRTYRNHCSCCHQAVSSQHPLQVSQATGAAGTHLGPRALGVAAYLNKQLGMPLRKTCQVLHQVLGVEVSAGGLSQALQRVGRRLQPEYDQLLDELRQQPTLYTDETGWWVGGPGYWLWVVTSPQGTYYRVVSSRSRQSAQELIGEDFGGVLVSDCLSIYDELNPIQQKCYAHHLKAISAALETSAGRGSHYLLELRGLLHGAMLLKTQQAHLSAEQFTQMRQHLEQRAQTLLACPRGDPNNPQSQQEEKLRQRLHKQQDHLFTFLDYPEVEATNNRAERQLRPAIICRKVSCGNKTEAGARTWEILASLAATCAQRGQSFIERVAQSMSLSPSS